MILSRMEFLVGTSVRRHMEATGYRINQLRGEFYDEFQKQQEFRLFMVVDQISNENDS
jgi:hypothetical protein